MVRENARLQAARDRPRLLIVARARGVAGALETAAVGLGYRVEHAHGFDDAATQLPRYRAVLLHAASLKPPDDRRFALAAGDRPFVVVIERGRLLDAVALAGHASGWLVLHDPMACLEPALWLVLSGYCSLPAELDVPAALDRQRVEKLDTLTLEERTVLSCLGRGERDRTIARRLGIPLARETYLVRRLIGKLRVTNRQTVAVFAARQGCVTGTRRA